MLEIPMKVKMLHLSSFCFCCTYYAVIFYEKQTILYYNLYIFELAYFRDEVIFNLSFSEVAKLVEFQGAENLYHYV